MYIRHKNNVVFSLLNLWMFFILLHSISFVTHFNRIIQSIRLYRLRFIDDGKLYLVYTQRKSNGDLFLFNWNITKNIPYMSLEVLDLKTNVSTWVNAKSRASIFVICLCIEETYDVIKGRYYFCREFILKVFPSANVIYE